MVLCFCVIICLISLQVSNFNLYHLGKRLGLHEYLISDKFEPTENWLPPCYTLAQDLEPMEGILHLTKLQMPNIVSVEHDAGPNPSFPPYGSIIRRK